MLRIRLLSHRLGWRPWRRPIRTSQARCPDR